MYYVERARRIYRQDRAPSEGRKWMEYERAFLVWDHSAVTDSRNLSRKANRPKRESDSLNRPQYWVQLIFLSSRASIWNRPNWWAPLVAKVWQPNGNFCKPNTEWNFCKPTAPHLSRCNRCWICLYRTPDPRPVADWLSCWAFSLCSWASSYVRRYPGEWIWILDEGRTRLVRLFGLLWLRLLVFGCSESEPSWMKALLKFSKRTISKFGRNSLANED